MSSSSYLAVRNAFWSLVSFFIFSLAKVLSKKKAHMLFVLHSMFSCRMLLTLEKHLDFFYWTFTISEVYNSYLETLPSARNCLGKGQTSFFDFQTISELTAFFRSFQEAFLYCGVNEYIFFTRDTARQQWLLEDWDHLTKRF